MNYVKNTTILLLAALTTTGCIADDTDSDEVDPTVGQHLTLSWPAGQDPSHITWPF